MKIALHLIKLIVIIILLCSIVTGNAGSHNGKYKSVAVSVLDLKTKRAVANATVFLSFIKSNATDIVKYSARTNDKGQCRFSVELCDNLGYIIKAQKDGYYPCLSTDIKSNEVSTKTYQSDIDKTIILYLTSDVQQLLSYYSSITPHYQIDTLIKQLKADIYDPHNRFCLPKLMWEDIPKLLEIGNDRSKITHFPVNPASSYLQKDCILGIFSLWLIESIRISQGKPVMSPFERFPSLNPMLNPARGESRIADNSNALEIAYKAYLGWWNMAKNKNPTDACAINPLENTGISW